MDLIEYLEKESILGFQDIMNSLKNNQDLLEYYADLGEKIVSTAGIDKSNKRDLGIGEGNDILEKVNSLFPDKVKETLILGEQLDPTDILYLIKNISEGN